MRNFKPSNGKTLYMKKVLVLATAAFLMTGVAFAGGDGKSCGKDKACCKKEAKGGKDCCKKEVKKDEVKKETKSTVKS